MEIINKIISEIIRTAEAIVAALPELAVSAAVFLLFWNLPKIVKAVMKHCPKDDNKKNGPPPPFIIFFHD